MPAHFQILALLIYTFLIASYLWATIYFFKIKERASALSKKLYVAITVPIILLQYGGFIWPTKYYLFINYIGLVLLLIALIIFWSAILVNKRQPLNYAFSSTMPATLTITGPYRLVRHPFYTAYSLGWIGATMAGGHYGVLLFILLTFLYYYKAAKYEENLFLRSDLGCRYKAYAEKTGMFIPKINFHYFLHH